MNGMMEPLLCHDLRRGIDIGGNRSVECDGSNGLNDLSDKERSSDEARKDKTGLASIHWSTRRSILLVLVAIAGLVFLLTNGVARPNHSLRSQYAGLFFGADPSEENDPAEYVPGENPSSEVSEDEEEKAPYALLFPWFAMLIGVVGYYLISRFAEFVPYTAFMFCFGTVMGYVTIRTTNDNAIFETIRLWLGINGELVLLVFLPGLLFLDSFNINAYMFMQSFWQLIIFAFPMVLGGTALTALVAYYIFPYGWSLDLAMTFGSILSATDPVAVAVLLNKLGAPSRLKIHIAGESLLNDGSAVVFYHIFSARFFNELGVEGFGEEIGWGEGFALFFRLSLGGACIGVAFGIGLVTLLYNFNRRLSTEENVVQVVCTIMSAYLCYFTSEIVSGCSGVIAVLFCGLVTKAFGETMLNDPHLTHDFWHVIEHMLNTTLFTLGGVVWGAVISDSDLSERIQHTFNGADWGYLFALYALLTVIRFVLIFAFFPVTSRLGISQSWREAIFMSHGGLRGAVGISLALSLAAEVFQYTSFSSVSEETRLKYRDQSEHVFGMVGGIAFLTLVINGPTSGPLLKWLGLVTPTEARTKLVDNFESQMKQSILIEYVSLLSEKRFENVDYGIVKDHVSALKDISAEDVNNAVVALKEKNPDITPNVVNLLEYISKDDDTVPSLFASSPSEVQALPSKDRRSTVNQIKRNRKNKRGTVYDAKMPLEDDMVLEERLIFLDLLRGEYHNQIKDGDLDSRGFIPFSLLQGLDIASDTVAKGSSLNDWAAAQAIGDVFSMKGDRVLHAVRTVKLRKNEKYDGDFHIVTTKVLQALSFIKAHEAAQEIFKKKFASVNADMLTLSEKKVLDESKDEVHDAQQSIEEFLPNDVDAIKSRHVCQILIHKCANFFENLEHHGLLTEKEVTGFLDRYDHELRELRLFSSLNAKLRRSSMNKSQMDAFIRRSATESFEEL